MVKRIALPILFALILASCGPGSRDVIINLALVGPVGDNPTGFVKTFDAAEFAVRFDEETGTWSGDVERAAEFTSVDKFNERIKEEFMGMDPFQLSVVEDQAADFVATGFASDDPGFEGASYSILLEAEDPYPGNGVNLIGVTERDVRLEVTLPGFDADLAYLDDSWRRLLRNDPVSYKLMNAAEVSWLTCMAMERIQTGQNRWIGTIELDPSVDLVWGYRQIIRDSITLYTDLGVTEWHATDSRGHECYSYTLGDEVATPTAFPTITPSATLPVP